MIDSLLVLSNMSNHLDYVIWGSRSYENVMQINVI